METQMDFHMAEINETGNEEKKDVDPERESRCCVALGRAFCDSIKLTVQDVSQALGTE